MDDNRGESGHLRGYQICDIEATRSATKMFGHCVKCDLLNSGLTLETNLAYCLVWAGGTSQRDGWEFCLQSCKPSHFKLIWNGQKMSGFDLLSSNERYIGPLSKCGDTALHLVCLRTALFHLHFCWFWEKRHQSMIYFCILTTGFKAHRTPNSS